MSLDELRQHPEWRNMVAGVKKTLDESATFVLSAAEREPIERVRFLAGQYAGIKAVYDYLRRP